MATDDQTENKPAAPKRTRKPAAARSQPAAKPEAKQADAARPSRSRKPAAAKADKPASAKVGKSDSERPASAKTDTKPATKRTPAKPRTSTRPASRAGAAKGSGKPKPVAAKRTAAKPDIEPAETQPSTASRALGIFSIGAAAVAIGAALVEGVRRLRGPGDAEHAAPDLALDQPHPGPEDRAPEDFRPDPTAPVPASEREALRPATMPLGSGRELDSIH